MITANVEKTAENIQYLAKRKNLTPKMIAKELNMSVSAVHKWYYGNRLPSIDALGNLSDLFGVRMDSIIIFDEVKK